MRRIRNHTYFDLCTLLLSYSTSCLHSHYLTCARILNRIQQMIMVILPSSPSSPSPPKSSKASLKFTVLMVITIMVSIKYDRIHAFSPHQASHYHLRVTERQRATTNIAIPSSSHRNHHQELLLPKKMLMMKHNSNLNDYQEHYYYHLQTTPTATSAATSTAAAMSVQKRRHLKRLNRRRKVLSSFHLFSKLSSSALSLSSSEDNYNDDDDNMEEKKRRTSNNNDINSNSNSNNNSNNKNNSNTPQRSILPPYRNTPTTNNKNLFYSSSSGDGSDRNANDIRRNNSVYKNKHKYHQSYNNNNDERYNSKSVNKRKRGSRYTMKRPSPSSSPSSSSSYKGNYAQNQTKNKSTSSSNSSSSSILPPPTTIHDFRMKQRLKKSRSSSFESSTSSSSSSSFSSSSSTMWRNKRSSMKYRSSSGSSLLPPTSFPPPQSSSRRNSFSSTRNKNKFTPNDNSNPRSSSNNKRTNQYNEYNSFYASSNNEDINDDNKNNSNNDEEMKVPSIEDLPPPSYLFGQQRSSTLSSSSSTESSLDISTNNDSLNGLSSFNPLTPSVQSESSPSKSASSSSSSSSPSSSSTTTTTSSSTNNLSSLDGVLPVSELFYRSTQSLQAQDDDLDDDDDDDLDDEENNFTFTKRQKKNKSNTNNNIRRRANKNNRKNGNNNKNNNESDDEELPFSAEQSDSILTTNNKICLRRNNALTSDFSIDDDDDEEDDDMDMDMDDDDDMDDDMDDNMDDDVDMDDDMDDDFDASSNDKAKYMTDIAKLRSSSTSSRIGRTSSSTNKSFSSSAARYLKQQNKNRRGRRKNNNGDRQYTDSGFSRSSSSSSSRYPNGRRGKRRKNGSNSIESKGRKMVRRGMEMLVGGEPINADPPLRFVELHYCFETANNLAMIGRQQSLLSLSRLEDEKEKEEDGDPLLSSSSSEFPSSLETLLKNEKSDSGNNLYNDWASVISTNSRDFGPLLHKPSIGKVSTVSRQIYCEHLINACMKWHVCPKDLRALTKNYQRLQENDSSAENEDDDGGVSTSSIMTTKKDFEELVGSIPTSVSKANRKENKHKKDNQNNDSNEQSNNDSEASFRGFGKRASPSTKKATKNIDLTPNHSFQPIFDDDSSNRASRRSKTRDSFILGGELKFTLGLTRAELEVGEEGNTHGQILRRVLAKGISTAIRADSLGFNVAIAKLILNEVDGGATEFNVEFNMVPKEKMLYEKVEQVAKSINSELAHAMDYGDMALAMGAAAQSEMAWPSSVRKRVVEEFLFDEDDDDEPVGGKDSDDMQMKGTSFKSSPTESKSNNEDDDDGPFGMPGETIYANDDIYLGGGNGGVFVDYSESKSNINAAPWQGSMGPILVDATIQRALQRQPRVIAIGDVHGCLDELQALLRRCDYRPGDLIVFLGDLVSKGPDSLSVVQMARELGAIGVRGNHDFEVIRWHQAIKSGADPPVVGSEHYTIASNLQKEDLKWMYSLPWYLSSRELNTLFVHAGFVSGIRLGKQNPRLMMNMRSILPDGTVTSKFFNNWPWARLWDGPQTVLFGHDADRGLQQYEHAIGLDTGCVYGGRLTACILPEKRLVSVSARRAYFQYRRKHFD